VQEKKAEAKALAIQSEELQAAEKNAEAIV
jgi:hypothetical protein